MSPTLDTPPRTRQNLLVVIMLGVLLASVGVAWLLTWSDDPAKQRGEAILASIRERQLPNWWGTDPIDLWYLIRDEGGRPVGWQHVTRRTVAGGYAGTRQIRLLDRQWIIDEKWEISADATGGGYEGTSITPRGRSETYTELTGGQVRITAPQTAAAASAAPPNYIPEGLNTLVFFLAAAGGEKTICQMVFDSDAVRGGRVNFKSVTLKPAGPNRLQVVYPGSGAGRTYHFDDRGLVERIHNPDDGTTYTRMPRADVAKFFAGTMRSFPP